MPAPLADAFAALRLAPEWERLLTELGFPEDGSKLYDAQPRVRDTPKDAAIKFVWWMRATGQAGEYVARKIEILYEEMCEVDHREALPSNIFLAALKAHSGVRYQQLKKNQMRRTYTITFARPPEAKKAKRKKSQVGRARPAGERPGAAAPAVSLHPVVHTAPQLTAMAAKAARRSAASRGRARTMPRELLKAA